MVKRQANGETKSLDKKFEIDTETFVVVSNFNGHLFVHIQKFNGDLPIQEGVCMFTNTYQQLLELLGKKDKGIPNLGQRRTRRKKMCCNGGTTGQGVLYTIENNSNKQLAIKVNMSLTR